MVMKCLKSIFLCFYICCNIAVISAQTIRVDDTKSATELAGILTNSVSCVIVSNENATGDTFTVGKKSYAYFNNQGGSFPFSEGIVLSTWSSSNSVGPFVRDNGGGSTSWLGDADLNQALGIQSINATVLEFDFIPLTNFISFDYIFASNEYQDAYPCEYSDGFAFLIKENSSPSGYKNLAVIPGTTTPVSSTNIHPAINYTDSFGIKTQCAAINPAYFGSLNTSPTNTSPINYAGQTIVMTAQTEVIAGKPYHIKLVIADDKKNDFDSAVFLKAKSFISEIDLGSNRLLTTNNAICYGEKYLIDTKLPSSYAYQWYKNNTVIPGANSPSYEVSDAGTYKVVITLNPTTCLVENEVKIEYTPEILLSNTTLVQCDDNADGFSFFNLTKADNTIKNNNTSLSAVTYYESLANAQGQLNPITNATNYQNKSVNQIVYARVTNSYNCVNYAELSLQISNASIASQNPVATCDSDITQDGLYFFDLNSEVTPQILTGLPLGLTVEYYLNANDAITQNNPLPNLFYNTIPNQQTIYARIVNGSNCYDITPIDLIINTYRAPVDQNFILCDRDYLLITINQGLPNYQYLWSTGATTNSITVNIEGIYTVKITNPNGCEATQTFNVSVSEPATITGVKVNDLKGTKNSILIEYTGSGDYEFSIDNSFFQDSPLFEGVAAGAHFVSVRDKNGCGQIAPFQVYVLDYPRYFTPNGDGYNDTWQIKNLDVLPKSTITIFDRYGKLLKQLNATEMGWNGTYNGQELPATDYWFQLIFEDGRIIKGHFSLKR